jgi:tetraacyldisaccharide 4'-kinase
MGRLLLKPLSWLYGAVIALRNRAFDSGVLRVERVPVPVIAVGNLTSGGTGKTPLVKYLARFLISLGRTVAVVSRGYGRLTTGPIVVADGRAILRNAMEGGDEPVELARALPGLRVVVAEKRIAGARLAISACGADVILLDDAFQHRSIHRDLNILVLESARAISAEAVLPAGHRREPLSGMRRADLIAWSGMGGDRRPVASVERWFSGPTIGYTVEGIGIRRIGTSDRGGVSCREGVVVAFCGIGNPKRFFDAVRELGPAAVEEVTFRDHHRYSSGEIDRLIRRFGDAHADLFITTEKDAARLDAVAEIRENFLRPYPVYTLGAEVRIVEGEERLAEAVRGALGTQRSDHTLHMTT